MSRTLFLTNYWGDKYNGFETLYSNFSSCSCQATSELVGFLRDASQLEDNYHKGLVKLSRRLSNLKSTSAGGSFAPCWDPLLAAVEQMTKVHCDINLAYQALVKDAQRHYDEQMRNVKSFKDSEHQKTANSCSSTKTFYQLAMAKRQLCQAKHNEAKKACAADSAVSEKEKKKATTKLDAAIKDYRFNVEKYNHLRNAFEESMRKSCAYFEEVETRHLDALLGLVRRFGEPLAAAGRCLTAAHDQLQYHVAHNSPERLIAQFVHKTATGSAVPQPINDNGEVFLDLGTGPVTNVYSSASQMSLDKLSAPADQEVDKEDKSKRGIIGNFLNHGRRSRNRDATAAVAAAAAATPENLLSGSFCGNAEPKVDSEGYVIREDEHPWSKRSPSRSSSSSSDDSEDQEMKLKVSISKEVKKPVADAAEIEKAMEMFKTAGHHVATASAMFRPRSRPEQANGDFASFESAQVPPRPSSTKPQAFERPPSRARPRPKTPDWSRQVHQESKPQPVWAADKEPLPLAAMITECVHCRWSSAACKFRVQGSLALSLPSSVLRRLPLPSLVFRLNDTDMLCNLKLTELFCVQQIKESNGIQFTIDQSTLSNEITRQSREKPGAQFLNLEPITYDLQLPIVTPGPVFLRACWNCEQDHTDLRIEISRHPTASLFIEKVTISAEVSGGVTDMQSLPDGKWLAETKHAVWEVPVPSKSDDKTVVKAKFPLTSGPSAPGLVKAQFLIDNCSFSDCSLALIGSSYRLSLNKRRIMSGQYSTEPSSVAQL